MKAKEIITMSKDEIQAKISELRKEMIKFNSQIASGSQIKNPSQIRETKKSIARLLQALAAKEE